MHSEPIKNFFKRNPSAVNLILFIVTFFFTLFLGTLHFISFYGVPNPQGIGWTKFILHRPALLFRGLPYSLSLMSILCFHEMGHYLACRRHGIRSTLPFFIPAPAASLSGTFGAFIKIQSPITSKKSLFDVGIAGPLAGFALALPVIAIGLRLSKIIEVTPGAGEPGFKLGAPLIFNLMSRWVLGPATASREILLHPVAFAGWFGVLVTAFNLIPIGQLDGGHILYSLFGKKSYTIGIGCVLLLVSFGFFFYLGWFVWAILVTVIGYRHPPVHESDKLDLRRKVLALVTLIVFLVSFTPAPLPLSLLDLISKRVPF